MVAVVVVVVVVVVLVVLVATGSVTPTVMSTLAPMVAFVFVARLLLIDKVDKAAFFLLILSM